MPVIARMTVQDKASGALSTKEATIERDEGNRPETTLEGLQKLQPVRGGKATVTAGNASQLSDGASACVVMEADLASRRGLSPLGRYVGMAMARTIYRGTATFLHIIADRGSSLPRLPMFIYADCFLELSISADNATVTDQCLSKM